PFAGTKHARLFHPIEKDQQAKHCRSCRYYEHMSENLVLDPPVTAIENMSVVEALDQMRRDEAIIAQCEARKIRAMARIHELRKDPKTGKAEFASDEIALEMRWSPVAASRKVDEAITLIERLPDTVDQLEAGRIDLAKARAVHELTST